MAAKGGVRLGACLPLRLSQVSPQAVERRRTAVLTGPRVSETSSTLFAQYDPQNSLDNLANRIRALEDKIDHLTAMLLRDQQREAREQAISMEIHGEGLRFRWPMELSSGEVLELALTLTLLPPTEIFCLARVTGCEQEPEDQVAEGEARQFLVDTQFVAINEDHRDAIHRFIFTSQRQQRRTERM